MPNDLLFEDLNVAASTAYAQAHTAAFSRELSRDVSALHGSFGTKRVCGKAQWYFSYRDATQHVRQLYVGPDSPELAALVVRHRQAKADGSAGANVSGQAALVRAALALGCAATTRQHLAVVLQLSQHGFFRAGGVLIGTHAFLAYANVLGVRWVHGAATSDVDFAHAGKTVSVALPTDVRANAHQALTTMPEGFLPMRQFALGPGPSYRHPQQADFQVDFLTARGRAGEQPVAVPNLDLLLQPLRFMEFSLQAPIQATLMDSLGRCVVATLPAPERYALHKLLVATERDGQWRSKVAKDVQQSAALLQVLGSQAPQLLGEALVDLRSRGPGWRKALAAGIRALGAAYPREREVLEAAA